MSETRKLHPDWPEYELGSSYYDMDEPNGDLSISLEQGAAHTAEAVPTAADRITIGQIAEVVRYAVSYHGQPWDPEHNAAGSELDMYVMAKLTDGRWLSVESGNDYTGWGCQDYSHVRVGVTEDDVIWHGLSAEARTALGYPRERP